MSWNLLLSFGLARRGGLIALVAGLAVAWPGRPAAALCPAELPARLDAIAAQPLLQRARLGIVVETQTGLPAQRQRLYSHDADQFFIPASNAKLLTTAAALHRLGPAYRLRTSVYGSLESNGQASLRLVGRGDPSLSSANLDNLARQLAAAGVRQVSRLVADDSYFAGSAVNPNWEWEDVQAGYGAPVNSLMLNGNAVELTLLPQAVGQPLQVLWREPAGGPWQIVNRSQTVAAGQREAVSVGRDLARPIVYVSGQLAAGSEAETVAIALPDPAQQTLQQFEAALARQGLAVGQSLVTTEPLPPQPAPPELAFHLSPPLAELLAPTNASSNNLYAEALLKTLGTVDHPPNRPVGSPSGSDATAAGAAAVTAQLTQLGLDPTSWVLADGSGLSRHNLVTPATLAALLQTMAVHPQAQIYRNSLAIAGVSGTLRNRLRNTPLQGRVLGKTGALSGNVTFSGYVEGPSYPPLVVSILINQSDRRASELRSVIDQMLTAIGDLEGCGS